MMAQARSRHVANATSVADDLAWSLGDHIDGASVEVSLLQQLRAPGALTDQHLPAAPFTLAHAHAGCRRASAPATPFASCSLLNSIGGGGSPARVPLFMMASASEPKKAATVADFIAPTWQIILGNLAAGAVSGCAVEAALYPIDTIKTRLQAMVGGGGFRALMSAGGGKALYAGIWGNLAGTAPSSAIFISVYEPVKKAVQTKANKDQQFLGPLLAGMAAGVCSSITRVPTEVVKSRLQTGQFQGLFHAVRGILAQEGIRGLYAGYGAFILRDLPFDAIEFVTYEQTKVAVRKALGRDLNSGEISLVGAFAGGFTGIVTTPLDVLKTRLMTQGTAGRYANLFDATAQILRTEGPQAFMRGWQPRLIWISLGGLVFFPVLEASKEFFAPKAQLEVKPF